MSWVVYAILAFVVIQTLVNLEFRKPGRAHEPAAEMEKRAKEHRFVQASMNGWARLATSIEAPSVNASENLANVTTRPTPTRFDNEVPLELAGRVTRMPSLFPAPKSFTAPATVSRSAGVRLALSYERPNALPKFGEPWSYAKDKQLFIFLQDETELAIDGKPVPVAPVQSLVVDTSALEPGTWSAKLFTRETIYAWNFTVE